MLNLKQRYWAWEADKRQRREFRRQLHHLSQSSHPRGAQLATAIEATAECSNIATVDSRVRVLEDLRAKLAVSNESVEHIDYGAGSQTAPVDATTSAAGIKKTFPIRELATHTSQSGKWTALMYWLIRTLKPDKALELGTCLGMSAGYQCAAMAENGNGRLITLEGGENFAKLAQSHLELAGWHNFEIVLGRFQDTLADTLIREQPFQFMFNDGHHDGDAVLAYFEQTLPYFADHSVMLFDDISTYDSMQRVWKTLTQHRNVDMSIDFGRMGLVCTTSKPGNRETISMPLLG